MGVRAGCKGRGFAIAGYGDGGYVTLLEKRQTNESDPIKHHTTSPAPKSHFGDSPSGGKQPPQAKMRQPQTKVGTTTRTSTPPGMARKPPGRPVRGQLSTARKSELPRREGNAKGTTSPNNPWPVGNTPERGVKEGTKSPPATHRLKRRPPRLSPTSCSRSLSSV